MASPQTRSSAGPLIGLVLLLVVVGGIFAAFQFLAPDEESDPTDTPVAESNGGSSAAPSGEGIRVDIQAQGTEEDTNPRSKNPIRFTVACMGKEGATAPMSGVEVRAVPLVARGGRDDAAKVVVSDAKGLAVFEDMQFKRYRVEAEPEGSYPLMLLGVGDGDRIPFVFGDAVRMDGVVIDAETDQPLADVYVQVISRLGNTEMVQRARAAQRAGKAAEEIEGIDQALPIYRQEIRTGADGRVEVPAMPIGYEFTVNLAHSEYDTLEQVLDTTPGQDIPGLRFVMLRRTEIFGRVLDDETGEPLAGVLVRASEGGIPIEMIEKFGGGADIYECETDEAGNYRLTNVARGQSRVEIAHPGYHRLEEMIELRDIEPMEKELRLYKGASITGTVIDEFGNAVADAAVSWNYREASLFGGQATTSPEAEITTDAEGSFKLAGLPVARSLNISVRHPDYIRSVQKDFTLEAGEVYSDLSITMMRGGQITGRVQTSDRTALIGAVITATPTNPPGTALTRVVSDEQGNYTVPNTPAGLYTMSCEAPGFCKVALPSVRDTATGVDFSMVRASVFAGTVVDKYESSKPVEVFKVRARRASTPSTRTDLADAFRDAEGKFEITPLDPTDWEFEFTAEGYCPTIVRNVTLMEGETTSQQIEMDPGITVVGKVGTARGNPAALALVSFEYLESFNLKDKTWSKLRTTANADGEYTMKNLAPGRYSVWASHPRYADPQPMDIDLRNPEEVVNIPMQRPARLRLIVRDEQGNFVPGAKVSLFRGNNPAETARTWVTPEGHRTMEVPRGSQRYGIGNLADAGARGNLNISPNESGELTWLRTEPGEWTLWIGAQGFYKYAEKLTLISGEEVVHTAVMERMKEGDTQAGGNRKTKEEKRAERRSQRAEQGGGKKGDGGDVGGGDGGR